MADLEFIKKYKIITEIVSEDFAILDGYFSKYLFTSETKENQIKPILKEFFSHKGKRIRSLLIFLLMRALGCDKDDFYCKLAFSNEVIHNATLIHDDIIDCSLLRRGRNTLNFDYDSKLAVLAGDYLLSVVLDILSDIDDVEIRKLHSSAITKIINGELEQYFNRFKILSIKQYVEKSKNKTSRLFETGLVSTYLYRNSNIVDLEKIRSFSINFGIAFQIDNDLKNYYDEEKLHEDLSNGDYSAPLIYYSMEKNITEIKNPKKVLKDIKNTEAIKKSIDLKDYYINLAIENIQCLEDNQYKKAIVDLCHLYTG